MWINKQDCDKWPPDINGTFQVRRDDGMVYDVADDRVVKVNSTPILPLPFEELGWEYIKAWRSMTRA